nr:MAG TPA: hypothetical protein [Inoviridae sp.]
MSANIIFSSSYWRIFKLKNSCVLCFYRFQVGKAHELETQETFPDLLETQETFPDLLETLKKIDSAGSYYPVILTSDGSPFIVL